MKENTTSIPGWSAFFVLVILAIFVAALYAFGPEILKGFTLIRG